MDILTDVLNRVRLRGTLLFQYELSRPWSVALPQFPDAVFHYLRRGSAVVSLGNGRTLPMAAGDFVLISHGEPHILWSESQAKPYPLLELDRRPAHLGAIHHGGERAPVSTMMCGYFSLSYPSRSSLLDRLPSVLHLRPEPGWLETIFERMVSVSAIERPGQDAMLSRITEMLLVDVLCSWTKSIGRDEGEWLAALADTHIGMALQLIHEQPERPWTLSQLAHGVGLGRSALAARFTRLVGRPVHRYLVAFRMEEAARMLRSGDVAIAQIAARLGYRTTTAFSRAFQQTHGLSPGRYRARNVRGPVS